MVQYERPQVVEKVFRDASGRVIEYGSRWGGGSPPEDTYSVVSHPERFAPLHIVADALISHLRALYDVEVQEDPAFADDLLHERTEHLRAVRLTPADPDAAPLTFVFTAFPGVIVHAGLLHDLVFPECGCDACDETWDTQAQDMEDKVFAVVAGRFQERMGWREGAPWAEHSFEYGERGRSGGGRRAWRLPAVRSAEGRLRQLKHGWRPWPARTGAEGRGGPSAS